METMWSTALWRQYGAAIDMLEKALVACPPALWTQRLWRDPPDHPLPPVFTEFWYLAYHTLFWLDLYLAGAGEDFAPPAPFSRSELEAGAPPDRTYTQEELLAYLAATRRKAQATLPALTDEQAQRPIAYPWARGRAISYFELQLYNMRHVQEHGSQLNLFLSQQGIPAGPDWIGRAREEPGDGQPSAASAP